MRDPLLAPLCRVEFDAQALMTNHPPSWSNANKQVVASLSCPTGCRHEGQIGFTRWRPRPLSDRLDLEQSSTRLELQPGFFRYEPVLDPATTVAWYLNFADPHLFGYYGGRLFAQDEMQVTEHPALGALRNALPGSKIEPLTVEGRLPTPALVTGVERRCFVATNADAAAGRPWGLYGNRFAAADAETIRCATTVLAPPTVSNILAIAALPGGSGEYTRQEIEYTLLTAVTGFTAACIESERIAPAVREVVIHTGHWGCGAFGGHRELMALLQILAAQLSGVSTLVFCCGDAAGEAPVRQAEQTLASLLAKSGSLRELITLIVGRQYRWGVSDGN